MAKMRTVETTAISQFVSRFRGILGYAKLAFTPVAVGFLLYLGWQSRETLYIVIQNARPGYLTTAVLAWIVLHFVAPILATLILNGCGSPVTYRFAFKTHAGRLPARYLPGGIWHTVGRMVDFSSEGIKSNHLAVLVFVETTLPAAITLAMGGACLTYFRGFAGWGNIAALGALGGVLTLVFLYVALNRWIFRSHHSISLGTYMKSVGVVILFWLIAAVAFISYVSAFPSALGDTPILEIGGTYLFSWGIGYISLFAPQGIGIFEAVAGNILSTPMSLGEMVALLAGFRLISLVADGVVWAASSFTRILTQVNGSVQ